MKLIKAFFYLIFVLIVLVVLIPIGLMIFVNPNQFKPQIQQEVQNALHRPFNIKGDLHWTFYPVAGIKASDVSMGNPVNFPKANFMSAKTVEFSVSVAPLLHKDIRIGEILMDGLNLKLIKNAKGEANWSFPDSASPQKNTAPKGYSTSSTSTKTASSQIAAFSISKIVIENSQITLDDATTNKHMSITDFNFKSSQVGINTSFPVKLAMTVVSNNFAGPLNLNWSADLRFSPSKKELSMTNIQATVNNDLQLTGSDSIVFGNTPTWHANVNLNNIRIENVLKLFKKNKLDISGVANISANLKGSGSTSSLNGDLKFDVQNGIFHGLDLYYYSDVADSLANKQAPTAHDTNQTPFGTLTGTAQIRNGVFENNDLLIKANKINASGQGTANLNTEQLNYHLSLQRMTSGTQIKSRGPAIPMTITGNFDKPSVNVDLQSLVVSQVKEQLEDKMKEYAPQLQQKIQQGLSSLLGN